jgi:hypothetical protein
VVLNVQPSTAISVSLTLRRDLLRLFPLLLAEDPDFACFWVAELEANGGRFAEKVGLSAEDLAALRALVDGTSVDAVGGVGSDVGDGGGGIGGDAADGSVGDGRGNGDGTSKAASE